MMHMTYLT